MSRHLSHCKRSNRDSIGLKADDYEKEDYDPRPGGTSIFFLRAGLNCIHKINTNVNKITFLMHILRNLICFLHGQSLALNAATLYLCNLE